MSKDLTTAIGVKGGLGNDWNLDVSASYGRNRIDFATLRIRPITLTARPRPTISTMARSSTTSWSATSTSTRASRCSSSLNLALGLEARREGYQITPGEHQSYDAPPTGAVPGAAPGAQGFLGFFPFNAIKRHRQNGSAYVDLEAQVTEKFLLAAAVAWRDLFRFRPGCDGQAVGKVRFQPLVRDPRTVSNGFRAPSLQQQYFTSVSSVILNGVPILTGTFPSVAPVSEALGGLPLQPEKSTNYSVGTVISGRRLRPDGRRLLHPASRISSACRRISPRPSVREVAALLAPFNVSAARFFINGLASRTEGVDIVGHYRLNSIDAGTFDFTAAANINKTKVTKVPTSTSVLDPAPTLFARNRLLTLTEGTPGEKVAGAIDWARVAGERQPG